MTTPAIETDTGLSVVDEEALLLAVETMRALGRLQAAQIDRKLVSESWFEAALFASYYCQTDALSLMPWEWPPLWIDDIDEALRSRSHAKKKIREAARLLQQMLRLGISKYHPNPLAAIAEAEVNAVAAQR